jgi:hypothetical protein
VILFLASCQKTAKPQIGNFFLWVFVSSFFPLFSFVEQTRNMTISNHHLMACMLMTSQMMIFSSYFLFD